MSEMPTETGRKGTLPSERDKLRAEIARLKTKQASSRAGERAKLQSQIDELHEKLSAIVAQAKRGAEERETRARLKAYPAEARAATRRSDLEAAVEERLAKIRKPKGGST